MFNTIMETKLDELLGEHKDSPVDVLKAAVMEVTQGNTLLFLCKGHTMHAALHLVLYGAVFKALCKKGDAMCCCEVATSVERQLGLPCPACTPPMKSPMCHVLSALASPVRRALRLLRLHTLAQGVAKGNCIHTLMTTLRLVMTAPTPTGRA